jgi:signal transduction histidine kinase
MAIEHQANLSHELRTSMAGGDYNTFLSYLVSGMIGLLSDANLEPEAKEYVNTLEKSVDSLMNLINDSLNFSRVIYFLQILPGNFSESSRNVL